MNMEKIHEARVRLQPYIHMTPLLYSSLLHRELKKNIWLKLETQLPTGTFKPRPAFNSILSHLEKAKRYGVVTSSSGNFAQGVAYAAKELHVSALIVMSKHTSSYKIERTKALGAEVLLCDDSPDVIASTTLSIHQRTKRVLIHPYNSEETIAGDGTIGLEISDQLGLYFDHDITFLVPVSGGGLLAGIVFALKNLHPTCKVIGIQPEKNGSLAKSFQAGKCIYVNSGRSIADALGAPLGELPFQIIKDYVDDVIEVTEDEIRFATTYLIEQHKLVVEPSGSVSIAALFADKISAPNVVCIISGGNVPLTYDF